MPSNWELLGYGTPSYLVEPANTLAEQGRYQYDFSLAPGWFGQRVFLVFDGVMTDTHAEINGQSVGPDHRGGFYRFKYEVTSLLHFKETNRLDVLVNKHSSNASVNHAERNADYWSFGGIFRPVYLEAVPQQFIQRVAINARADGAFAVNVFVGGITDTDAAMSLEARIVDLDGKAIAPLLIRQLAGEKTTLQARVQSPRQWTAETPNLYKVEIRLKQRDQVRHQVAQRFGFRTVEVRAQDGFYVNGKRIVLKGADRHSFWPDSGRCLSEAVHRMDINALKDMNMNAVRISHYPPDEQFLDLCDELGLYVLDEVSGWGKTHNYDTPTGRQRVEETVTRDVNHPAILFWDNGNEGGWNKELDSDFAKWDPQQRLVLHPWTTFNGVNAAHYLTYEKARRACEGVPTYMQEAVGETQTNTNYKAIYMPTEFMHGLYDGGAGSGLEDMWTLMQGSKVLGGGFIWALVDEGLKRADTKQIDVVGNQAPDGIVGPYRQKEASFYTIKEVWSPIRVSLDPDLLPAQGAISEALIKAHTPMSLRVENHYSFIDAKECEFSWQFRKFHRPDELQAGFTVLAQGKINMPSIQPGTEGKIELPLPTEQQEVEALAVRANAPDGREIWTWVWPLEHLTSSTHELIETKSAQRAAFIEISDELNIKAGDLVLGISKQTGLLANVTWRVHGNGWVDCSYTYTTTGPQDFHGVTFDYPEHIVKKKKWLGQGPYRVWKNRLRGGTLNVWENDYNNTITGWRGWIYPEFKGCFAGVRWLQLESDEGPITIIPGSSNGFVQVLTPEFPPIELQRGSAVSLPRAGLAFLEAIPPMGTKFYAARASGSQGQANIATGSYSNSVSFYFGPLSP